jgi:hypothetical protein
MMGYNLIIRLDEALDQPCGEINVSAFLKYLNGVDANHSVLDFLRFGSPYSTKFLSPIHSDLKRTCDDTKKA